MGAAYATFCVGGDGVSRKFTPRELELGRKMLIAAFITIASALIVFVPMFDEPSEPEPSGITPEQVRQELDDMSRSSRDFADDSKTNSPFGGDVNGYSD